MKKIPKYKLDFMNKGKEFEIPHMTVALHEDAMDEMTKYDKLPEKKYGRLFNKTLVMKTLQQVDANVTLEHINNMHPDDYLDLFELIWSSGRIRKSDTSFRTKK